MGVNSLKGKLLEYTLRRIFLRCGFTNVIADNFYIFNRGPLMFIQGKGAAHDADVLMNPPVQMPFSYPVRLLFECKCYDRNIGLPIIRNAFGLREDLNNFEVVTLQTLRLRQNNRRASLAIENRKRYFYQVGVASISSFSKPAEEFAANNKIPLFSLSNAFPTSQISDLINSIDTDLVNSMGDDLRNLEIQLSHKSDQNNLRNPFILQIVRNYPLMQEIEALIDRQINLAYVGVIESGEIIFIYAEKLRDDAVDIFDLNEIKEYTSTIHWSNENPEKWWLIINNNDAIKYSFFIPSSIARNWAKFQNDKEMALEIKSSEFTRIFVFGNSLDIGIPYKVISLNREWINRLQNNNNQEI